MSERPNASPRIDAHVHVYPDRLAPYVSGVREKLKGKAMIPEWSQLRAVAQFGMAPFFNQLHAVQPMTRYLPTGLRTFAEKVGFVAGLPALLMDGSPEDLARSMEKHSLDHVVAIAYPPQASNEYVLDLASKDPRVWPVVMVPPTVDQPERRLTEYVEVGARALKVHPSKDSVKVDSEHAMRLLETCRLLKLPVILHTGCFHVPFQEGAEFSDVSLFESWFSAFPEVKFLLAHMNFNEPEPALQLAEKYPNLHVDTSWQPEEMIREAVRRLGAPRVLYASDWPFLGNAMDASIARVNRAFHNGWISTQEHAQIMGEAAMAFFKRDQN